MSRAELIQIFDELNLDYYGMNRDEMTIFLRQKTLKLFDKKNRLVPTANMSLALKKFLYYEHCFVFKNKDGELVYYKGDPLPRSKRNK